MIPFDTVMMFLGVTIALAFAPGPDNIFVLTQSAMHGRRAGLLATLGFSTGVIVHTAAVATGAAVIFQSSALAFTLLKLVGAAYLIYLAYQAFRAKAEPINGASEAAIAWHKLYVRGIVMNVTNPKVAIFFLAFLPQFADPTLGPIALQIMSFGGLFVLVTLVVFGGFAWFAGFLGAFLKRSDKAQLVINRMAGTVFAGLALRLLVTEK